MAKQNVTFVERHLEKFAMGVTGAVLLAVVALYLIGTPNKVEVGGESLGPDKFYDALVDAAETARGRIKTAKSPPAGPATAMTFARPVLPREIAVAPVGLNLSVPDVTGSVVAPEQIKLAEILPPVKPHASTGRAGAKIPPTQEVLVGGSGGGQPDAGFVSAKDWYWVALCSAISRKAQRAEFAGAGYEADRRELVVAEVEAEREELLPDGQWAEPQMVKGYAPSRLAGKTTIELVEQGGRYRVDSKDDSYITAYRAGLESRELQAEVLRLPFQYYLQDTETKDDDRYEWQVPKKVASPDGVEIDLTDPYYEISFPPDDEELAKLLRLAAAPGAGGEAKSTGTDNATTAGRVDPLAMKRAKEKLKQAEEAITARNFVKAKELCTEVTLDSAAPELQKQEAQKLLDAHKREFEQAEQEEIEAVKARNEGKDAKVLGDDVEAIWLTDTTVEPGRTYHYRIRLLAVNHYAGRPDYLENPLEARNIIQAGQWSEWSDPVAVKPVKCVFVTKAEEQQKSVRVTVYEWSDGQWRYASNDLTVGQPVSAKQGRQDLSYDSVVADIDFHRPYRQREQDNNSGPIKVSQGETAALTMVNSKGEVEERTEALDTEAKRSFSREIKEEEKRRKALLAYAASSAPKIQPRTTPGRPAGREQPRPAGGDSRAAAHRRSSGTR